MFVTVIREIANILITLFVLPAGVCMALNVQATTALCIQVLQCDVHADIITGLIKDLPAEAIMMKTKGSFMAGVFQVDIMSNQ